MTPNDALTLNPTDFCLAKEGEIYAIYLPQGGSTKLDLKIHGSSFSVKWYNPRASGNLKEGDVRRVSGPGRVSFGNPPAETEKDWVAVVKRIDG